MFIYDVMSSTLLLLRLPLEVPNLYVFVFFIKYLISDFVSGLPGHMLC